jgi:hypothetical protein
MFQPKIIVSQAKLVTEVIDMKGLGRLYSQAYFHFEWSMTESFRLSNLVIPSAGTVTPLCSENGVYWGSVTTKDNTGVINVALGDYERASAGGIVEFVRATPSNIADAVWWRVLVQRS